MSRQIVNRVSFRKHFQPAMEAGIKTCTTRLYGRLGRIGDLFYFRGGLYEITGHEIRLLGQVAEDLWREEGAESPSHFAELWQSIHGSRIVPFTRATVTHFRRLPVGTFLRVMPDGVALSGDKEGARDA